MSDNILKDTLDAVAIYKKSIINETLEAVKERMSNWLDKRIAFATQQKEKDDSMNDALGERYWHGIIVAYMGCKEEVEKIKSEQKS